MYYPIIDSHFHIWDTRILRYPWLDECLVINKPFLLTDYAKALEGIHLDGAVYVEVTSTDALREIEWVTEVAHADPLIRGIVAWCAIEEKENIHAVLEQMAQNPLIKGVRRMLKKAADPKLCISDDYIEGLRLLPQYGFVNDVAVLPSYLPDVYTAMKQCEEVKFVLEHCAEPNIKDNDFASWSKDIERISKLPNAYCKLSGFITKADPANWSAETLRPYIEFVVEKFGFNRVMFGSDWPPIMQVAEMKKWIDTILEVLAGETDENMNAIFNGTASAFFGLTRCEKARCSGAGAE